jgi:hypothetical protein
MGGPELISRKLPQCRLIENIIRSRFACPALHKQPLSNAEFPTWPQVATFATAA